ncbi:MAG: aspartyl-tRNA(Asn)/glutamyl-tRNA(Gln) amidotransferase subunit B, partial [Acidimicrobiales bacterium]
WDEDGGRSTSGRSKEDADDYRYFACPDLPPLTPTAEDIAAIDAALPALPAARRSALAAAAGVEIIDTTLTVERGLDRLVIGAIEAGADAPAAMKHADQNLSDGQGHLTPESFAALVVMEADGSLSSTQVKTVLAELAANGGEPGDVAAAMGFEAMDTSELESLLDSIIAASPDEWARFVEGDRKVQGHFVGQIMKATQGKADGKVVNQLMTQRASEG